MISALASLAIVIAGALPRTLRAAFGDAQDSRKLARTILRFNDKCAALEQLAAAEADEAEVERKRADDAERRLDLSERVCCVLEKQRDRAQDAASDTARRLQEAEGAAAVQRAELASLKRDYATMVTDSLRHQDALQRIARGASDPVRVACEALLLPMPAPVAHSPLANGAAGR